MASMTLVFKRAKAFVATNENEGTKKFLAQANPANPIPVPFWVADTPTFKRGIEDGSIINLTPPAQMPGYQHPALESVAVNATETSGDAEQTEIPQAPFGAQPMTPVPPAKVGGVRPGSARAR